MISVNGNVAALVCKDVVELARQTGAALEVNLFHREVYREKAIKKLLEDAGATNVLGVGEESSATIPEISSERRIVDPKGILKADLVFVPLEDGDRTEALTKMGKKVVTVDLNPLSRTARSASITIVDNVVRAVPLLVEETRRLKVASRKVVESLVSDFNNRENIGRTLGFIAKRIAEISGNTNMGVSDVSEIITTVK